MKINFLISEHNYYVQKCIWIYQSHVTDITYQYNFKISLEFFLFLFYKYHIHFYFLQMWMTSVKKRGSMPII